MARGVCLNRNYPWAFQNLGYGSDTMLTLKSEYGFGKRRGTPILYLMKSLFY